MLEGVCGALEEQTPKRPMDEMEQGKNAERSIRRGG
jgi:hypothetical protein